MNAELERLISASRRTVFFGGAGVSTESGIPDFRGAEGLYNRKGDTIRPERIISHAFFERYPDKFYEFYFKNMLFPDAKPNAAHLRLAALEAEGKLAGVVTQNIDGLHQAAGSRNVAELHGSVWRNHCTRCGKAYGLDAVLAAKGGVPKCGCGGIIKPDVVLYDESLDDDTVRRAVELISSAELLIIGGTSLTVYPAAGFIDLCRGKTVLINKTPTARDDEADLLICGSIGEVLSLN